MPTVTRRIRLFAKGKEPPNAPLREIEREMDAEARYFEVDGVFYKLTKAWPLLHQNMPPGPIDSDAEEC